MITSIWTNFSASKLLCFWIFDETVLKTGLKIREKMFPCSNSSWNYQNSIKDFFGLNVIFCTKFLVKNSQFILIIFFAIFTAMFLNHFFYFFYNKLFAFFYTKFFAFLHQFLIPKILHFLQQFFLYLLKQFFKPFLFLLFLDQFF